MAKLRFIKPWGDWRPGDTHEPKNANTIHLLVDVYKLAVIEPDNPVATAEPAESVTEAMAPKLPERNLYKYVRKPHRNKMMTQAPRAKNNTV